MLSVSPFTKDSLVSSRDKSIFYSHRQSKSVFADLRPVVCCLVVAGSDGFVIWSVAAVAMVSSGLRLALTAA